jgi:hypothetical protein
MVLGDSWDTDAEDSQGHDDWVCPRNEGLNPHMWNIDFSTIGFLGNICLFQTRSSNKLCMSYPDRTGILRLNIACVREIRYCISFISHAGSTMNYHE